MELTECRDRLQATDVYVAIVLAAAPGFIWYPHARPFEYRRYFGIRLRQTTRRSAKCPSGFTLPSQVVSVGILRLHPSRSVSPIQSAKVRSRIFNGVEGPRS